MKDSDQRAARGCLIGMGLSMLAYIMIFVVIALLRKYG